MSVVNLNSVTGISSIAAQTDEIRVINSNGTPGKINVGVITAVTSVKANDVYSDRVTTGIVTGVTAIQATTFYGNGIVPIGAILMWSGTIANIPTGWALCNGSNGTPDLRSRFIVGAGTDTMNVWGFDATTGAQTFTASQTSVGVGSTGGEVAHQLTIAELAAHNHTIRNDNNNQNGSIPNGGDGTGASTTSNTAYISNTGGDKYHENRPPYFALAFIMRTS